MSDATLKTGDMLGKLLCVNPKNDLVRLLQPIVNECIKNYQATSAVDDIDGNGNFS